MLYFWFKYLYGMLLNVCSCFNLIVFMLRLRYIWVYLRIEVIYMRDKGVEEISKVN